MDEKLTRCGYRCDLCLAYKLNIAKNDQRELLSDKWFEYYGFRIPKEDIYCDGCLTLDSQNPILIDKSCPVRPCVLKKQIDNCGFCNKDPCEKLNSRFVDLEDLEEKHNRKIPLEDYEIIIRPYENKKRIIEIRQKLDFK